MDWTEINIEISADQVDEAAAIAQMVVPMASISRIILICAPKRRKLPIST